MFQLRADLSYCLCRDRILFLDLAADRYFCLGGALERSFRDWLANGSTDADIRALRDRAILQTARIPNPAPRRSPDLPARADLLAAAFARKRDLAEALASELVAASWIRTRPIKSVIGRCARFISSSPRSPGESEPAARSIVAGLERSAFWLGSTDRCLRRAIAAMIMCRRRKVAAELVLGVRIDPFGAHAWVQHQDRVLVGDFEQVRLFTPILSVP